MFKILVLSFANEDDKRKFETIYDAYKKKCFYKAVGILNDEHLAEDAVSETFLRIYKNLHKILEPQSLKTAAFVATIVTNVSITLLNQKKKGNTVDFEDFETADDFDLEAFVVSRESAKQLFGLVGKLKDELKTPFLLKYAHDMSHKDISQMLGITENNVTVRIHRAKTKLAKLITEGGDGYEAR